MEGKKGDKYIHTIEASNCRLDAIQAAVLRVKLKHLEDWTARRRRNASLYNKYLRGVVTPFEADYAKHVYHLYVIRAKKRDELQGYLREKNVSSGIHYPVPLHLQPAYKHLNLGEGSFPITEKTAKEILSLPMFPELEEEEIKFISQCVNEFEK